MTQEAHFAEPIEIRVPMTDGAMIALHRYEARTSPSPTVLTIVPYRKESAGIRELARVIYEAGYEFLVADVRGFGGSDPPYEGLLSDREIQDGVELVDWIANQPFCDGQVALMGGSYFGANQILIAARRPPALRCIAPFIAFVDTYRDMTHRGGIPSHTQWGAMVYLRSGHAETARAGLEHYYIDLILDQLDNPGHRARSPETFLSQVTVPTLCLGGWHDYFLRGTVRAYLGVKGPKRLVVGPWSHGGFGPDHQEELVRWLGHWLRGEGADPTVGNRVRLYLTGAGQWRESEDWPDLASRSWLSLYPQSNGTLLETASDGSSPLRVLTHLEMIPPAPNPKPEHLSDPTDSGMGLWGEDAVFDSAPSDRETIIEGPLCLVTRLRSTDCNDLDVRARVSIVAPDGTCRQLTEGRLRASHRAVDLRRSLLSPDSVPVVPWHTHLLLEPLPSDEVAELHVEIEPVCHQLARGEKLRLGVTLVRSDEGAVLASALLDPTTRLLLPMAPESPNDVASLG